MQILLGLALLLATGPAEVWCPGTASPEFPGFRTYRSTELQLDPEVEVHLSDPLYEVEHLYDCEKRIYRFVLRARAGKGEPWILQDVLDIRKSDSEWVDALSWDCYEKRNGEANDQVIALLTGYIDDYRVAKAWGVSHDGRKFVEIAPETVTCTLDDVCHD